MNAARKHILEMGEHSGKMELLDMVLLYIKMKSPNTQVTYGRAWQRWLELLAGPFAGVDWHDAKEIHALQYIEMRRRGGLSEGSLKTEARALHALYYWLKEEGEVQKNVWHTPLKGLHGRPGGIRPSQPLTPAQTRALLNAPDCHTLTGIRDRAMLALLWSGFRVSEVLDFRESDLMQTAGGAYYMRCRKTKSGHAQERPIGAWAAERVAALIGAHRQGGAAGDFLLITKIKGRALNKRLSTKAITRKIANDWVKKYAAQAGLSTRISPHWGRCTAICRMRDGGADLAAIRQTSGHSSVAMVEYYDRRKRGIEDCPVPDFALSTEPENQ